LKNLITTMGDENGTGAPSVVRTKKFAIKPMQVDEAILQMSLLGHDFYVFSNSETDQVNVLYRRKDGNFGLIEQEF
jgi:putative sigma-54 modulation protein